MVIRRAINGNTGLSCIVGEIDWDIGLESSPVGQFNASVETTSVVETITSDFCNVVSTRKTRMTSNNDICCCLDMTSYHIQISHGQTNLSLSKSAW